MDKKGNDLLWFTPDRFKNKEFCIKPENEEEYNELVKVFHTVFNKKKSKVTNFIFNTETDSTPSILYSELKRHPLWEDIAKSFKEEN